MISFEPIRKKFNGNERYVRVIHSLQVDTFYSKLASVTSSLIAGEEKKKTRQSQDYYSTIYCFCYNSSVYHLYIWATT